MLTLALPAAAQVAVTDAWVRGTVTGQKVTGAFMQLKSPTDTALVAVTSPVAKVVEIHEMKQDGGMMKMRAVDKVALPAGKSGRAQARRLSRDADGAHRAAEGRRHGAAARSRSRTRPARKQTLEVKAEVKALTAADLPAHKH